MALPKFGTVCQLGEVLSSGLLVAYFAEGLRCSDGEITMPPSRLTCTLAGEPYGVRRALSALGGGYAEACLAVGDAMDAIVAARYVLLGDVRVDVGSGNIDGDTSEVGKRWGESDAYRAIGGEYGECPPYAELRAGASIANIRVESSRARSCSVSRASRALYSCDSVCRNVLRTRSSSAACAISWRCAATRFEVSADRAFIAACS